MKHNVFNPVLAVLSMAVYMTSCMGDVAMPEILQSIPDGVEIIVSTSKDTYVTYDEAQVSASLTVSYSFYYDGQSVVADKVFFRYGTRQDNLNEIANATPKQVDSYYSDKYTLEAKLTKIEDGAEYYFQPVAKFGKEEFAGSVEKFIVLPKGAIDLDLESGNLWYSHNLGAENPDEAGKYYAWGEIEEKKQNATYSWSFYKWCNGSSNSLTKYTINEYYSAGLLDNILSLQSEDDAVAQNMKGNWRMPTIADFTEIKEQCGWVSGSFNGQKGWFVRSKSNPDDPKKVIFLPFSGYKDGANVQNSNYDGYYWISSLSEYGYGYYAQNFHISYGYSFSYGNRCLGETIRPVRSK